MTHTKDEALKLALEYLEDSDNYLGSIDNSKPIAAIKQALTDSALDRMAENARELGLDYEPVAWVTGLHAGRCVIQTINPAAILPVGIALYTTPPAQPAPVQEPVAWKNAALELGIELSSVGPNGYYDMTPERWLDWAMAQQPRGKNSLPAAQRQWVGLTVEEKNEITWGKTIYEILELFEAKLKEKNT